MSTFCSSPETDPYRLNRTDRGYFWLRVVPVVVESKRQSFQLSSSLQYSTYHGLLYCKELYHSFDDTWILGPLTYAQVIMYRHPRQRINQSPGMLAKLKVNHSTYSVSTGFQQLGSGSDIVSDGNIASPLHATERRLRCLEIVLKHSY
jgi:hypothetical protein